jgi:hypothetical protein
MGGLMFKEEFKTSSIELKNVEPTLQDLKTKVLMPAGIDSYEKIGSTGKKALSGDIDIAISLPEFLNKKQLVDNLKQLIDPKRIKLSGNNINISYPIVGAEGNVQIDIMLSQGELQNTAWLMAGVGDKGVKGLYRNLLLSFLAKNNNFKISFPGGLILDPVSKLKTNDPQIILDKLKINADPETTLTFEDLTAAALKSGYGPLLIDVELGFENYIARYLKDSAKQKEALKAINYLKSVALKII